MVRLMNMYDNPKNEKDKFSVLKPFIYQLLLMSRKFVEINVEHKKKKN